MNVRTLHNVVENVDCDTFVDFTSLSRLTTCNNCDKFFFHMFGDFHFWCGVVCASSIVCHRDQVS